jgi:hypothetical protein
MSLGKQFARSHLNLDKLNMEGMPVIPAMPEVKTGGSKSRPPRHKCETLLEKYIQQKRTGDVIPMANTHFTNIRPSELSSNPHIEWGEFDIFVRMPSPGYVEYALLASKIGKVWKNRKMEDKLVRELPPLQWRVSAMGSF